VAENTSTNETEINSNELSEDVTIIPDDEIAPMEEPQTESLIEDM